MKRMRRRPSSAAGAAPARRELSQRAWPRAGATLVLGVVGIVGAGAGLAWHHRDALAGWSPRTVAPVQRVLVEGPFERVSPTAVENAVLPHLRGGFFTVDLAAIRAAAEALPWVARAQVLREWPDRVRIVVTEQRPAWLWGEDGLLNADAELFVTGERERPAGLPRLDGPAGSERALAEQYLALDAMLSRCAMRVARLQLDARRAARLTLAGGIVLRLGRDDVADRVRRFCGSVLAALSARLADVAYVDMRYTNGFAVGWRGG
jgi:cell division protein FtsQ